MDEKRMISEILILKEGLRVFHRAYTKQSIENIDLTSGLFHAVLLLSKEVGEKDLESIDMGMSKFHFKLKSKFTFIIRETVNSLNPITKKQISSILESLCEQFFFQFPFVTENIGDTRTFNQFNIICDEIIKAHPVRQGIPLLLDVLLEPFFIAPITKLVPISLENQETYNELQYQLKIYSDNLGDKVDVQLQFKQPFIISLPAMNQMAYVFPIAKVRSTAVPTHLACLITDENNWFTMYQLIPLINKKADIILPILSRFIEDLEIDVSSNEMQENIPIMLEILSNWSDLSQYVSVLNLSLFEEFYRSGISRKMLSEYQLHNHFDLLLQILGDDFDKLIFSLLAKSQIVFIGDKSKVEKVLSALLAFYPSPSLTIWTKEKKEHLIVGTHPDCLHFYSESSLIVDLTRNAVLNGHKYENEYCKLLMNETIEMASNTSLQQTRLSFQAKISGLFALIKSLLEIFTIGKDLQKTYTLDLLKFYPADTLSLIIKMGEDINHSLFKNLQNIQQKSLNQNKTNRFNGRLLK